MGRNKGPGQPAGEKQPTLTHFLCLPLVNSSSKPQLESSMKSFRDDVSPQDPVAADKDPVFHPKAIRPVGALHFTLGVMSLDADKLSEAVEFLKSIDIHGLLSQATSNPSKGPSSAVDRPPIPLTVDLKGLVSMHSPKKTSILYSAPLEQTGRLLPFCVALLKQFKDKGFLQEENRSLKLHATIVNTLYAKGKKVPSREDAKPADASSAGGADQTAPSQGKWPNRKSPPKFDATAVIEKYKDFAWAENVVLDRVAICEMGVKKIMDDGGDLISEEYTEVATVRLPS